ncbi:MAG: hypothetical protein HYY04_18680 [Chloroflexi bacterium]|nr:hypothetical protein [Chloroflexota bacterium]
MVIEDAQGRGGGAKAPDCTLRIAGDEIRKRVQGKENLDTIWRTWVHESLHARQPYGPSFSGEYTFYRGYEEGFVEGLARWITRQKAGMNPAPAIMYNYYVEAYRALAVTLAGEAEMVWREFWRYPPGEIRARFLDAVSNLYHRVTGDQLTGTQRQAISSVADDVFSTFSLTRLPSRPGLVKQWRSAFS